MHTEYTIIGQINKSLKRVRGSRLDIAEMSPLAKNMYLTSKKTTKELRNNSIFRIGLGQGEGR